MAKVKSASGPPADKPSHTKGIKQGNSVGSYDKTAGMLPDGRRTAESVTGVNAQARNPIDPRMPGLFPG